MMRNVCVTLPVLLALGALMGCGEDDSVSPLNGGGPVLPNRSWSRGASPAPQTDLNGVHLAGDELGWAVGNGGAIFRTTDGGRSWTDQSPPGVGSSLQDVFGFEDGRAWAVGNSGMVLATVDSGAHWNPQASGTGTHLLGVSFSDARHGVVVGLNRTIRVTSNGGSTWRGVTFYDQRTPQEMPNLYDVTMVDAEVGYAVGRSGGVYRTADGGEVWVKKTERLRATFFERGTSPPQFYAVAGFAESFVWAAGSSGVIAYSNDAGFTWSVQREGTNQDLLSLDLVDPVTAWGGGGREWAFTGNGGYDWFDGSFPDTLHVRAVSFSPSGALGLAVGEDAAVVAAR
jgi:photosystem II stability/assembly factor-like uncharacterized protein